MQKITLTFQNASTREPTLNSHLEMKKENADERSTSLHKADDREKENGGQIKNKHPDSKHTDLHCLSKP